MNYFRLTILLAGIVLIAIGVYLAIHFYGRLGALILPGAAVGLAVGSAVKSVGGASLEAPEGRPRRGTVAASPADPKPVEGKEPERRTRARRGGSGWRR